MAAGPIPGSNGGTGVDNGNRTMTLTGGNIALTLSGDSNLTLPAGTHAIPTATGGGASGTWPISISGSAASVSGTLAETKGGTGNNSYVVGDTLYASAIDTLTKLPGNITAAPLVLTSIGDGLGNLSTSWQPLPVIGTLIYYLTNTASDVVGDLKQTSTAVVTPATLTTSALTNGQLVTTWITDLNNPNLAYIPAGQYSNHIHAAKTAGSADLQIRVEMWETNSAGVDIAKIADLGPSVLLSGSNAEYFIADQIDKYVLTNTSSRIANKLYAVVGSGSAPTIGIYVGGVNDSRTNLPTTSVDASNFVPYTGATANVDLGSFKIKANGVESSKNGSATSISNASSLAKSTTPSLGLWDTSSGSYGNLIIQNGLYTEFYRAPYAGGAGDLWFRYSADFGQVDVIANSNPANTVGGSVNLYGGTVGNSSTGGNITINGGNAGTSSLAGNVYIRGGSAVSGQNGNIFIDQGFVNIASVTPSSLVWSDATSDILAATLGAHLSLSGGGNLSTDATNLNTASTIVSRDASGNFSAGTITAALSGNATTATSSTNATNATNATNIAITNDVATNASMFPVWVTANTGNLPAKVSSTKISFNPSTGLLNLSALTASQAVVTDASKNLTSLQYTTSNTASTLVQRDASSYIFSTGLTLSKAGGPIVSDYLTMSDTTQAANNKNWGIGVANTKFTFYTQNDAQSSSTNWLEVLRSGNNITSMTFPVGNVIVSAVTSSTTPTTGALVVTGGVGISGAVNTNGTVTLPQNLTFSTNITSNATVPTHRVKIVANEAIAIGEILKVSTAVDFRVEKMKTTDATSIAIVGVAATASAAAGDVIEVYGMSVFPVITNSVTTRGDYLIRSGAVSGRVIASVAAQGVFAVALQSGVAGNTILATLKWSESF